MLQCLSRFPNFFNVELSRWNLLFHRFRSPPYSGSPLSGLFSWGMSSSTWMSSLISNRLTLLTLGWVIYLMVGVNCLLCFCYIPETSFSTGTQSVITTTPSSAYSLPLSITQFQPPSLSAKIFQPFIGIGFYLPLFSSLFIHQFTFYWTLFV